VEVLEGGMMKECQVEEEKDCGVELGPSGDAE
jgi:hypothetical protein